ncbi:MAG: ubiquinol-cytochrome c reductase cytochrome b subunit [Actinomycetota bacterium]|nr:ubiquinol-cytochrome c reductase cytochrome b subunit [Actinomycetota bacterium]
MILRRMARWTDDRLGSSAFAEEALNKVFPDHWSFMLGEISLYCFVILILTGTFLTFFFDASSREIVYRGSYAPLNGATVSEAYASVVRISFDVRAGLVMRQIHHWAALLFIGAIVLHLCRIFFTGAFRRPRELNWIIGVTLLILAIFNGFTGYSLPDDLLSGTGLRIAYSIALSVPLIGTWVAFLIFGGEFPAQQIISRLFVIHIMLIPALIIALLGAHLAILWRQKHTQFPEAGRTESNVVGSKLWPTYAAKSVGLFCAIFAVLGALGGLAQINPIWLYGPFDPAYVASPSQPDWFLGWVDGALRLFPAWEFRTGSFMIPNPFFPGVLLPGITFGLLYLWPFLEARLTHDYGPHELLDRPTDRPVRSAIGAGVLTFYIVLLFSASNDVIARMFQVPVLAMTVAFRIALFVIPLLVAYVVYRWFKAVKVAGAEGVMEVSLAQVLHPVAGEK